MLEINKYKNETRDSQRTFNSFETATDIGEFILTENHKMTQTDLKKV